MTSEANTESHCGNSWRAGPGWALGDQVLSHIRIQERRGGNANLQWGFYLPHSAHAVLWHRIEQAMGDTMATKLYPDATSEMNDSCLFLVLGESGVGRPS